MAGLEEGFEAGNQGLGAAMGRPEEQGNRTWEAQLQARLFQLSCVFPSKQLKRKCSVSQVSQVSRA